MSYLPTPEKLATLGFAPTTLLQGFHFYQYRLGGRRLTLCAEPTSIFLEEYDPASRTWPQVLHYRFQPECEAAFDEVMRWRGWLFEKQFAEAPTPPTKQEETPTP